jgi:hypothetical protein
MKIAQQIVGVNQRLGNTAVPNMQGTTRSIFDTRGQAGTGDQTLTFFNGVSSRAYPLSNINNNRFEVGESLAITQISVLARVTAITNAANTLFTNLNNNLATTTYSLILNLFIGNQRVLKDLDLNYGRVNLGESLTASAPAAFNVKLETPIVIPPQIEFYATLRQSSSSSGAILNSTILVLSGQGTLLNTKSTF